MDINQKAKLFRDLNSSSIGQALLAYLEEEKLSLFTPEELTAENLSSRKDTARFIEDKLIKKIKLVNQNKEGIIYPYQ